MPFVLKAQVYRFDAYDQAQGLNDQQVQSVAFDRKGFLWVATANGLYRFLGSRFERYGHDHGLSERSISEVYVDSDGHVWANGQGRLYVEKDNRFLPLDVQLPPDFLVGAFLSLPNRQFLAVNENKLYKLQLNASQVTATWSYLFPPEIRNSRPELNQITAIVMAHDGALWMGCGKRICLWNAGILRTWGPDGGVDAHEWNRLYIDRRGSLWALSAEELLEMPAGSTHFLNRTPPGIQPGRYFPWPTIAEDRHGRILASLEGSLVRRDQGQWQSIGPANGLNSEPITSIAIDANGDPWMGTLGGVSHWTGYEQWEAWTSAQGLPSSRIWSVGFTRKAHVLIGTAKGPALLETTKHKIITLVGKTPWRYGQVGGIAEDKHGRIWISTFTGFVLRLNLNSRALEVIARPGKSMSRLLVSEDGQIWILSYGSVDVIENPGTSLTVKHAEEVDLLSTLKLMEVTTGLETKGVLWIKKDPDLLRFEKGKWSRMTVRYSDRKAFFIKEISAAPDGTLWVAGDDQQNDPGVWNLKPSGSTLQAVRLQLPTNFKDFVLYSICVDRRGWVWVGSDNGLAVWNGSSWRVFNRENGMINGDTNRGVLKEAPDGSIWVGTSQGLAHLTFPEGAFDPVKLPMVITHMQRGGQIFKPGQDAALSWDTGELSIRFACPTTWDRSNLTFFYRLLGLKSSWTSTQEMQTGFANLPPGDYRFQAYGHSPGLASTSPIAELTFQILPPWWKTVWFYSLSALACVFLLRLLLQLRTKQLQTNKQDLERLVQEMSVETARLAKREQDAVLAEERNRLAMELHDALAGAFTGIFMQLQAASDLAVSNVTQSNSCIRHAEELSRDGLQQVRKFVQMLTSDADNSTPTFDVMRRLITVATDGTGIEGTFVILGEERHLKLTHAQALMRIIQEAVGNAQRYADATKIEVTLSFGDDSVSLTVSDNGKGFAVNEADKIGFGIAGMRARTERLAGEYRLRSAPGQGTTIYVELPHAYGEELQPQ